MPVTRDLPSFDFEGDLGGQVVPEVLSHPGQLVDQGYSQTAQVVPFARCRTASGYGRLERPGAQHHPFRFDGEYLAPASTSTPTAFFLREQHLPYEHVTPHSEVETMAPRMQMGDSGAHPPPIQVVRGPDTDAYGLPHHRGYQRREPCSIGVWPSNNLDGWRMSAAITICILGAIVSTSLCG